MTKKKHDHKVLLKQTSTQSQFSPLLSGKSSPFYVCTTKEEDSRSTTLNFSNLVGDCNVLSGLARRVSPRLSGIKRPFYGSSMKRKSKVEVEEDSAKLRDFSFSASVEQGDTLTGSERSASLGLSGKKRISIDNVNEKSGTENIIAEEELKEEEGDTRSPSSEVVQDDDLLLGSKSSFNTGQDGPLYGCSDRKISSDTKDEEISLNKITKICESKTELRGLWEEVAASPCSEMLVGGDQLTSSERRASSRLLGKRRPFYGSSKKKTSADTNKGGIKTEVAESDKMIRDSKDLKEDDGTRTPSGTLKCGDVHTGSERLSGKRRHFRGSSRKKISYDTENQGLSSGITEIDHTKGDLKDLKEDAGTKSPSSDMVQSGNDLTGSERRASSRLSGKKRPFYGSSIKKIPFDLKYERTGSNDLTEDILKEDGCDQFDQVGEVLAAGDRSIHYNRSSKDVGGKSAHQKVKKTIMLFNKLYHELVQGEVETCEAEVFKKSPKKSSAGVVTKHKARPDLKAVSKMMEMGSILYRTKRFGSIPGIDVGYQFFSRAEMVVVGLHGHWLKGIDFMSTKDYSKLEQYKSYKFPLAVSVVMSGMYEDDLDNSEEVVYTGQGGNNLLGNKRQVSDQVMTDGNLALKNNMEQKVPVRLIRSHKSASSYTKKAYTYDGLYMVTDHWAEKGLSGFTVFKYRLRRIEGQPALISDPVSSNPKLQGRVCDDISGHQENIPIPATNLVDKPPVAPMGYTYSKSIQLAEGLELPTMDTGCSCKGACTDPTKCACAKLNGDDFPYVSEDGGRLFEPKSVVYECGPKCKCGPKCVNRTSQRGLRFQLEVFRTKHKGWGVRSWDFIPSGSPVCEYTGKLMRTADMDHVSGNDFIFEIDCLQTMEGLDGRESREGVVSLPTDTDLVEKEDKQIENECEFCIDAGTIGGVARFINHSCEPNLFVQCVLSSHRDIKLARVVLFASDDISPYQELTYDYGYVLDSVTGPDGKIKVMPCYCGEDDCRKRLY